MITKLAIGATLLLAGCGTGIGQPSANTICRAASYSDSDIRVFRQMLEHDRRDGWTQLTEERIALSQCPHNECVACWFAMIDEVYE